DHALLARQSLQAIIELPIVDNGRTTLRVRNVRTIQAGEELSTIRGARIGQRSVARSDNEQGKDHRSARRRPDPQVQQTSPHTNAVYRSTHCRLGQTQFDRSNYAENGDFGRVWKVKFPHVPASPARLVVLLLFAAELSGSEPPLWNWSRSLLKR